MRKTFAFLRAINVGSHTVTMARLRELFEGFGLRGVETFIASGNLFFEAGREGEAALARRLEAGPRGAGHFPRIQHPAAAGGESGAQNRQVRLAAKDASSVFSL